MHKSLLFLPSILLDDISSTMFIQLQSFEAELPVPELAAKEGGPETFRGMFIRAPAILEVGLEVEVLAEFPVQSNKLFDADSPVESQKVCFLPILLVNSLNQNIQN